MNFEVILGILLAELYEKLIQSHSADLTPIHLAFINLTYFLLIFQFYVPWKHQKTIGFYDFYMRYKRENWLEMNESLGIYFPNKKINAQTLVYRMLTASPFHSFPS